MSAKHTPGPWRVGVLLETSLTRRWPESQKENARKIESLCVFSNFLESDQGRSRNRIAVCDTPENARLIAAAPELLSALETLHGYVAKHGPESMFDALDRSSAVIAKARGEA